MSEKEPNQLIVLPWEFLEPVASWYEPNPDHSKADAELESENLLERMDAIELVLMGEAHPDLPLEIMIAQGINPDSYIEEVVENLNQWS